MKFVTFQHLRDGEFCGQADDGLKAEFAQPLGVVADFCLFAVENLKDLIGVGLGVLVNFLAGQWLAGHGASGRIANQAGVVADQEDHGVAEVLKVLQLANQNGVAEMKIGRGRIEASFDAQGAAGGARLFQASAQLGQRNNLCRAFLKIFELFVDRGELATAIKIGHDAT